MDEKRIIVPTKEEIRKLLNIINNDNIIHIKTVGELLGMKLTDSLVPQIKGEPEWGYDGLKKFFLDNGIDFTDTLKEAENKLK